MSDWQPIETAPTKDEGFRGNSGPRLLLTDGASVSIGHWDGYNWGNEAEIVWGGDDGAWHDTWQPTHWMPLPEPPGT